MFIKRLTKLFLLILACFLLLYGYVYYKKYHTIAQLDEKVKMGRYRDALNSIQELQNSPLFSLIEKLSKKEDPMIA